MEQIVLNRKIEETRLQMIKLALQYGYTHEKTITCSEKLDNYLNQLNKKLLGR